MGRMQQLVADTINSSPKIFVKKKIAQNTIPKCLTILGLSNQHGFGSSTFLSISLLIYFLSLLFPFIFNTIKSCIYPHFCLKSLYCSLPKDRESLSNKHHGCKHETTTQELTQYWKKKKQKYKEIIITNHKIFTVALLVAGTCPYPLSTCGADTQPGKST